MIDRPAVQTLNQNLPMNFHPPQLQWKAAVLILISSLAVGSAQDLSSSGNTVMLMKELDQITQTSAARVQKRRNDALAQINNASSSGPSALDFYLNALENSKYSEAHPDFIEWKKKNQDILRNSSMANAALVQLKYLALALQRSDEHSGYSQVPDYMAYVKLLADSHFLPANQPTSDGSQDVSSAAKKNSKAHVHFNSDQPLPEAIAIVKQPLDASVVVFKLQISDLLPKGDDFESSPGNYESILEKNIRVPLRNNRDQRILSTWDDQIRQEAAAASAAGSPQQIDLFNRSRLPQLLFGKAQDTVAIGQPNRGIAEMMQLIRTYPDNPSVSDWIQTTRGLLGNTNVPSTSYPPPSSYPSTTNQPSTKTTAK
jgi:hypothetical protein